MNILFVKKYAAVYRLGFLFTVLLSACENPTPQTRAPSPSANDDSSFATVVDTIKANGIDTSPLAANTSVAINAAADVSTLGTAISIRLPANTSRFLPGPKTPLADATPCLSCHSQLDVDEFQTMRSPSYEVTKEICSECHTADYVSSQPPGLGVPGWQKVVKKMVDRFDPAAINSTMNPEHQALMVEYLSATYP